MVFQGKVIHVCGWCAIRRSKILAEVSNGGRRSEHLWVAGDQSGSQVLCRAIRSGLRVHVQNAPLLSMIVDLLQLDHALSRIFQTLLALDYAFQFFLLHSVL